MISQSDFARAGGLDGFTAAVACLCRSNPVDQLRAGADRIELTAAELKTIDDAAPKGVASGQRYPPAMMAALNR